MKKISKIILIVMVVVLVLSATSTAFADTRPYSASLCQYGFWSGSLTQIYDKKIWVEPSYSWIGNSSNSVPYEVTVCVGQNLNNKLTSTNKTGREGSTIYSWGEGVNATGTKRYLYGRIQNAYYPGQNMRVAGTISLNP